MRTSRLLLLGILFLGIFGLAVNVKAIPVTYEFRANVKHTVGSSLSGFIAKGDSFTGRFSYDTGVGPYSSCPTCFTMYKFNPQVFGINLSIGSEDTFIDPAYTDYYRAGVSTNFGGTPGAHVLTITSITQPVPDGWPDAVRLVFSLNLSDNSASVFSDNSLPMDLTLSDFDKRRVWIGSVFNEDNWAIDSEIVQLDRLNPVPEPSIIVLLGSGLFGFIVLRKKIYKR